MKVNLDTQRLWFSRASFGFSAVALAAVVYGGCQDRSKTELSPAPEHEQSRVSMAVEGEGTPKDVHAVVVEKPGSAEAETPKHEKPSTDEGKKEAPDESDPDTKDQPDVKAEEALIVKRLVVTDEIEAREPRSEAQIEIGDGPVIAFVELENKADPEQQITITFEHGERKVGFVELKVPGNQKRWRTWGQTHNIKQAGEWVAVVSTRDGVELSRTTFDVAPPQG